MDPSRTDPVPNPAVRRLSLYLRQLEAFSQKGRRTVSSKQLGTSLNLTDAQVRKDLAYFGQFGHPGIGYRVEDLIGQLRHILGTDKTWNVLLVGAGNRKDIGPKGVGFRGSRNMRLVSRGVKDAQANSAVKIRTNEHKIRPVQCQETGQQVPVAGSGAL